MFECLLISVVVFFVIMVLLGVYFVFVVVQGLFGVLWCEQLKVDM